MTDLVLRRLAGAADAAVFKNLRLEALRLAPSAFSSDYGVWEAQSDAEWLKRLDLPVFGAFVDGKPAGTTGLWPEALSAASHRAVVAMVYVRAEFRGHSLSEKLVAAAIDHAKTAGFLQLELMVTATNLPARRIYERLGFVEYGRLNRARKFEDGYLDDVMMTCKLA